MKLTQQDKARILGIDARTLRNWRKEKTYLYEIIEKGFAFEEFVKTAQEKIDDEPTAQPPNLNNFNF